MVSQGQEAYRGRDTEGIVVAGEDTLIEILGVEVEGMLDQELNKDLKGKVSHRHT